MTAPAPAMSLVEHGEALRSIVGDASTLMVQQVVQYFDTHNADHPEFGQTLRQALPDMVMPHANAAALVTAQWYDELNPGSDFHAIPVVDLPADQIDGSARWALYAPGDASPMDRLAGATKRMVADASRATVVHNAETQHIRYARLAAPDACAFCRLLATRDTLYTSEKSATTVVGRRVTTHVVSEMKSGGLFTPRGSRKLGEKYHDHCRCVAVPVPPGQIYTPPDYVADWEQQYSDARTDIRKKKKKKPMSTQNILTYMRRADGGDQKGRLDDGTEVPLPPAVPEPVDLDNPQRPTDDPLPNVRVKESLTSDVEADLVATNPNYKAGEQWKINCTRCATAVDLRARGYEVTAEPKPASITDNGYQSILERWESPSGVVAGQGLGSRAVRPVGSVPVGQPLGMSDGSRAWDWLPAGKKASRKAADKAVTQWGEGSRGFITVVWAGRKSAHIFNVVNRGGTVMYVDGQDNTIDASEYFDRISTAAQSCRIVRTDDLTPTAKIMDWVRERTDDDITLARKKAAFLAKVQSPAPIPTPTDLPSGAGDAPGSAGGGSVDRSQVPKGLKQHELDTADRLASKGHQVVFIPPAAGGRTADVTVDGEAWELKALTGASENTIQDSLRRGRGQSPRIILDLTKSPISDDRAKALVDRYARRYDLQQVRVIRDADGLDWRWTADAGQ